MNKADRWLEIQSELASGFLEERIGAEGGFAHLQESPILVCADEDPPTI